MLGISETEIIASLGRDNPWWTTNLALFASPNEKERAYFKSFLNLVTEWKIRRSVILLGPRRVGKTVMLHQLIREVMKAELPAKNVFFASVDTPLYSGIPLATLVEYFEKETKHDPNSQRLIVFDEIQYLKNWEVHLKVLTDRYPNTKFVASGSAAAALRRKSQESGAGRFTDFFLPPLTFAEFLKFRELEQQLVLHIPDSNPRRYSTSDIEHLNEEFIGYLNYGGYPEAVLNENIREDLPRFLGRDIIDKVLLRDLPSLYGIQDIQELNRLFTALAYNTGQEISLDGLSKSSGVAKNTIAKYLEYLEASFLIARVTRVDDSGRTFTRQRQFKVYLTNPSMRSALFAQILESDQAMGAMAETAIFSQWFHAPQRSQSLHYARWKKGKQEFEVDLVMVDRKRLRPAWAYEIKWSDRFARETPNQLYGLIELAKKNGTGTFVAGATTKTLSVSSSVDGIKITQFPSALHCYQIGKNLADGLPP